MSKERNKCPQGFYLERREKGITPFFKIQECQRKNRIGEQGGQNNAYFTHNFGHPLARSKGQTEANQAAVWDVHGSQERGGENTALD